MSGILYLLCEGQMERLAEGRKSVLEVGAVVGDTGFIANVEGPGEELVAKGTCAVMVLYRMNMIDALKRFPEVKPHFEAVSRKSLTRQKSGEAATEAIFLMCVTGGEGVLEHLPDVGPQFIICHRCLAISYMK